MPPDAIATAGIGRRPSADSHSSAARPRRLHEAELAASGILADSRWPGRLCGAWRNEHGRIGTLWARTLDNNTTADAKYLYLRGASRTNLPPYGLSDSSPARRRSARRSCSSKASSTFTNSAPTGSIMSQLSAATAIAPNTFERLHRLGIETVTLCLDNDDAGRAATPGPSSTQHEHDVVPTSTSSTPTDSDRPKIQTSSFAKVDHQPGRNSSRAENVVSPGAKRARFNDTRCASTGPPSCACSRSAVAPRTAPTTRARTGRRPTNRRESMWIRGGRGAAGVSSAFWTELDNSRAPELSRGR